MNKNYPVRALTEEEIKRQGLNPRWGWTSVHVGRYRILDNGRLEPVPMTVVGPDISGWPTYCLAQLIERR